MVSDHSLNTGSSSTQALPKQKRHRYKPDDVSPRPPRGRPRKLDVAFKCPAPQILTGGESINLNVISDQKPLFCGVDYLTFNVLWERATRRFNAEIGCPFEGDFDEEYIYSPEDTSMEITDFEPFIDCLADRGGLLEVVTKEARPFNHCRTARGFYIVDQDTGELIHVATVGLHEYQETKRWNFVISGSQCPHFDFAKVRAYLEKTQATITRLDLAVDDFEGVRSVAQAKALYDSKSFVSNSRNPSFRHIDSSDGSTFYIGKRTNGKELCVYQKGKESKSLLHPNWVRWEQRFANVDRVIPYDALTNTSGYFLGAHSVFPLLFPNLAAPSIEFIRIRSKEKVSEDIATFFKYASLGYGAGVKTLLDKGVSGEQILSHLSRRGTQASIGQPTAANALAYFDERRPVWC